MGVKSCLTLFPHCCGQESEAPRSMISVGVSAPPPSSRPPLEPRPASSSALPPPARRRQLGHREEGEKRPTVRKGHVVVQAGADESGPEEEVEVEELEEGGDQEGEEEEEEEDDDEGFGDVRSGPVHVDIDLVGIDLLRRPQSRDEDDEEGGWGPDEEDEEEEELRRGARLAKRDRWPAGHLPRQNEPHDRQRVRSRAAGEQQQQEEEAVSGRRREWSRAPHAHKSVEHVLRVRDFRFEPSLVQAVVGDRLVLVLEGEGRGMREEHCFEVSSRETNRPSTAAAATDRPDSGLSVS